MGRRVGHKRSDRRWEDDEGNVWASKLEFKVYRALQGESGISILERCEQGGRHTFNYISATRSGLCQSCGSRDVVQERTYTPDLYVVPSSAGDYTGGYYLEVKGHFRAERRKLLRDFLKTGQDIDLRFVLERDTRATSRLNLGEYITKYMKCPWHVWDGRLPRSWL